MITPIQAVSSIATASPLTTLARVSQLSLGGNSTLNSPSVILSLGATASAPLTYNAAGLFESLLQVAATPQGTGGDTPAASAVTDLATLLGLGTTATSANPLATTTSSRALPAAALPALTTLLARDFGPTATDGANAVTGEQALASLLASDLDRAATGLDTTATSASVFNATGILQALPPDTTVKALGSLLAADLGLAATALGTSSASGSLLTSTASLTGSDQSLPGLFAAATASVALNATPSANADTSALESLLLSEINLAAAESGVATSATPTSGAAGATETTPAEAVAGATNAALETLVATTTATTPAAPETDNATVAATTTAAATTAPVTASATTATVAPTATATTVPPTETVTTTSGTAVSLNFLLDPATQALNNIAANPAYAMAAAGLYLNVAVFRAQQASAAALADAADTPAPIAAVGAVDAI